MEQRHNAVASGNFNIARVWDTRARQLKREDKQLREKLENVRKAMTGN